MSFGPKAIQMKFMKSDMSDDQYWKLDYDTGCLFGIFKKKLFGKPIAVHIVIKMNGVTRLTCKGSDNCQLFDVAVKYNSREEFFRILHVVFIFISF